jgi:hypothetical protein
MKGVKVVIGGCTTNSNLSATTKADGVATFPVLSACSPASKGVCRILSPINDTSGTYTFNNINNQVSPWRFGSISVLQAQYLRTVHCTGNQYLGAVLVKYPGQYTTLPLLLLDVFSRTSTRLLHVLLMVLDWY